MVIAFSANLRQFCYSVTRNHNRYWSDVQAECAGILWWTGILLWWPLTAFFGSLLCEIMNECCNGQLSSLDGILLCYRSRDQKSKVVMINTTTQITHETHVHINVPYYVYIEKRNQSSRHFCVLSTENSCWRTGWKKVDIVVWETVYEEFISYTVTKLH